MKEIEKNLILTNTFIVFFMKLINKITVESLSEHPLSEPRIAYLNAVLLKTHTRYKHSYMYTVQLRHTNFIIIAIMNR